MRIPAFAISAWIPERTVVTAEYRNTSLIRTLRERWSLGPPLTDRDAVAADIAPVLTLDTPRDPDTWPAVTARPVPPFAGKVPAPGAALRGLTRAACSACFALAEDRFRVTAEVSQDLNLTRADAIEFLADIGANAFPHLHG